MGVADNLGAALARPAEEAPGPQHKASDYLPLPWAGARMPSECQAVRPDQTRLDWTGLGWAGLGWAGLGWAGLGWAGLDWAGLDSQHGSTPEGALTRVASRSPAYPASCRVYLSMLCQMRQAQSSYLRSPVSRFM